MANGTAQNSAQRTCTLMWSPMARMFCSVWVASSRVGDSTSACTLQVGQQGSRGEGWQSACKYAVPRKGRRVRGQDSTSACTLR